MENDDSIFNFPLFEDLPENLIDQLQQRAWKVEGEEDSPVYREDDSANLVYLLHSGRVRLYFPTSDHDKITLDYLETGDLFGELALVNFDTRGEGALTLEPSKMTVIPSSHFRKVMVENTNLFELIFDYMNSRRFRIQNRLKTLTYEDARDKIIYVLLDLSYQVGERFHSEKQKPVHETHQELAEMSGLARPTVTKTLKQLKNDALIESGNGVIHLKKPLKMKDELNMEFRGSEP